MARIKFGAIVTDASGKLGGHVFAKNRGGSYMRTKVNPVNPSTSSQSTVRNRMSGLAQSWKGLSESARGSWNKVVNDYKVIGFFGDSMVPSGFNLYCKLNANLLSISENAITSPLAPAAVGAFSALSFTMSHAVPAMSIVFAEPIPATAKVVIEATAGVSQGRSFVKSQFRRISVLDNTDVTPFNALADYVAKFGATAAVGEKVFIRATFINLTTGQKGTGLVASFIVVA